MNRNLYLAGFFLTLYIILVFAGNFKNSVVFTGDEWEYQVIAVNYSCGYGFLTTGRIEDIQQYKITDLNKDKLAFWESKTGKAYYRSPFYPFFLCTAYQIIGNNPLPVKMFQLLLVFFAGLFLIGISEKAWGKTGIITGTLACFLFILFNFRFAEHMMPENWQLVFISLIVYLLFDHFRNHPFCSVILGIILGISVLNKGTTFFLFPLILLSDGYLMLKGGRQKFRNSLLFAVSFLLVTVSWSFWLSKQLDRPAFISTQPKDVLLDGNNEYCADGLWHPEWRNDPNCFYYSQGMQDKNTLTKLTGFYLKTPAYLRNLKSKVNAGFVSLLSVRSLLSLFLVGLTLLYYKRITLNSYTFQKNQTRKIWFCLLVLCIPFAIYDLFTFMKVSAFIFLLFLALQFALLIRKSGNVMKLPYPFILVFVNFFIFTIVFYVNDEVYPSRFVKTMEGIIILSVMYYLIILLSFFQSGIKLKALKNEKKKNQQT